MKYLLIENEEGQYIKINGTERYDILECHEAVGPRANEFVEFPTLQDALDFWELTPLNPEPVEEVQEVEDDKPR